MKKFIKTSYKVLVCFMLITLLNLSFSGMMTFAANKTITISSVELLGPNVTAKGVISGGGQAKVTILVHDKDNNISYINEQLSDSSGNFEFQFPLKDETAYGRYTITIGGEKVLEPAVAYFDYIHEEKAGTFDIDITLSSLVPTITGTIESFGEREIKLNLLNKTDNVMIADETIVSEDGIFEISYTLPSIIYSKDYNLVFTCKDKDRTVALVDLDISISTLTISASGKLTVYNNARISGNISSNNTDIISKDINYTGNQDVSYSIPKIITSVSANINGDIYQTVDDSQAGQPEEPGEVKYICQANAGDEVNLYINLNYIKNIADKTITINYNASDLQLLDACTLTYIKDLSVGIIPGTNIEILALSEGLVSFKINSYTDTDKVLSGTVSGMRFKALKTAETEITLKIE